MSLPSALQPLDPAECWSLLESRRLGRVAFTERALPSIRPLNYTLDGHRIVLRIAREGLGRHLDGQIVAFEVDDVDPLQQSGWSVVVTGIVHLVQRPSELARTTSIPGSWAGEGHQDAAVISVGQISGRRIEPPPTAPREPRILSPEP